jgi:hypothetical protein
MVCFISDAFLDFSEYIPNIALEIAEEPLPEPEAHELERIGVLFNRR